MGIFQDAVSNIKKQLAEIYINKLHVQYYGLQSCEKTSFKTISNLKLELIFLENIDYLTLTLSQNKKIQSGNFKNLFIAADDLEAIESLKLQGPIQINNITNVYNNNGNDLWEEFAL